MKSCLNNILYSLVKVFGRLNGGKTSYRARVKSNGTYDVKDVCRVMAERMHDDADLSKYRFYVDLFESTVRDLTMRGYRVKTDLVETGLSISGVFDSVDGEFDAARHVIRPTVSATKRFKDAVSDVAAENKIGHLERAKINGLMDAVTHRFNEIAVGHEIHLQGVNLGIDTENADEGVYLEDAKGGRVAAAVVLGSDRQTVQCRFDRTIRPGAYAVRVVCRSGASVEFRPSTATLQNVAVVA